ncbi:MAG: UxaA family hydrolase [Oscillospiraceae bacterium]|nr:UxaA family hydrolase [Oscillospiraceae bacterium]
MSEKPEARIALQVDEKDNTATIFADDIRAGDTVEIRDPQGGRHTLTVLSDVPYGHKIALRDIARGEHIIKYGESIGAAQRDIPAGDYVHVHNIAALRGRGDL